MMINLTLAQLCVLESVDADAVSRWDTDTHWHLDDDDRAVTVPTRALMRRGLIAEGPRSAGRIRARLTDHGRAVLDELTNRGPNPTPRNP